MQHGRFSTTVVGNVLAHAHFVKHRVGHVSGGLCGRHSAGAAAQPARRDGPADLQLRRSLRRCVCLAVHSRALLPGKPGLCVILVHQFLVPRRGVVDLTRYSEC